jgi:hypothetical protein
VQPNAYDYYEEERDDVLASVQGLISDLSGEEIATQLRTHFQSVVDLTKIAHL